MYKIISILFVITLINAAPPAEYTAATAKAWKDAATASLAAANQAQSTAAGLTATQQTATTNALGAQKAGLAAYTAAVATLATENQKNLAQAALASAANVKYQGLLAATNTANTDNQLNIANVAATNTRKTNMAIPTATANNYATQTKALQDGVEVTGNTGLVGLAAGTKAGYDAVVSYLAGLISTQTTDANGSKKSDATASQSAYTAQQGQMAATAQGTKCDGPKTTALSTKADDNVLKQVAWQTATGLLTATTAVQTEWTTKMGAAGANNKMTLVGTEVGKVKSQLVAYMASITAQNKVVTDQQAVVAGLVSTYAGQVTPLQTAYNDAKAKSDADNTVNTNAASAATAAATAYNAAVTSVTSTRATRDSSNTAAMTANGALNTLQVAQAATTGQVNYERANLALANQVVAEVSARATMRANLVSAASTAATAAQKAADDAATAAAAAAAAAVTQAKTQLATDTAAAVAKAKADAHKMDLVLMTKWNQSYALDALIAQKICDAAIADATKKTL